MSLKRLELQMNGVADCKIKDKLILWLFGVWNKWICIVFKYIFIAMLTLQKDLQ